MRLLKFLLPISVIVMAIWLVREFSLLFFVVGVALLAFVGLVICHKSGRTLGGPVWLMDILDKLTDKAAASSIEDMQLNLANALAA